MSVLDDPKTFGRARLSFADARDIDEFVTTLERFERGEITPDEWRQFRLVRGTYGQRQAADAQMLRVKIPQASSAPARSRRLRTSGSVTRAGSATSRPARTSSFTSSSCTTSSRRCAYLPMPA